MLYVFYVDIGRSLTFDMNLVNESVLCLKHVIEENHKIPANKQVLLISGGESLVDEAKVCSYSSGTDTNPIYLFNRTFLERQERPNIADSRFPNVDGELNQLFDSIDHLSAPVSIYTINKINMLAQKYLDQAVETKAYCDQLNTDQLLQHQGWAAAIANLDDVLDNFRSQCDSFDVSYSRYLETRQENIDLINRFSEEDLKLLSRIPLLPALLDGNEEERARLEMCCDKSKLSDLTLLQWISSKESDHSLENLVEIAKAAFMKYDEHALVSLKEDVERLFHPDRLRMLHNTADISEKLMTLSGLIVTIKDAYEDQAKRASGIKRNHDRAAELKEDSILPDLVATHRDTLRSMKANHTNLRSCRQLCTQSKKELCDIIHKRLQAIMIIQKQAAEIHSVLSLHLAYLKEIRRYIDLIQQLHTTPKNYLAAVSEVVRRRSYSQAFLMWASDLACRIFSIYTEETERRKKFLSQFEGHFLNCLFPGLEDMPPTFATQSPPLFDNNLPALCEDDLNQLCQNLPDLKECMELPDVDAVRNFFLAKSLTLSEVGGHAENVGKASSCNSVNDKLAVVMTAAGLNEQSQTQDMIISSDSNYGTQESAYLTDSNRQAEKNIHEEELHMMRDGMAVLGTLAHNTVISLRNDLSALRSWVFSHQSEIVGTVQNLYSMTQQQQAQIQNLLQSQKIKDDTIKALLMKISSMEMERLEEDSTIMEKQIQEAVAVERDRAIKEVTEQLTQNHKKEIEMMRLRFKQLVACANMERCPSDTSLEKIERGDVIELASHESLMSKLKFDMDMQLENAIVEERYNCERRLTEELKKFENEKQLLANSVRDSLMEEFDKQMDTMRIRETSLLAELQRHKDTIHTLTGPEGGSNSLMSRIEELESEKNRLQSELIKERHMKYSSSSSSLCSNPLSYVTADSEGSSTSLSNSSPELPQNKIRYKDRIAYKKSSRGSVSYLQGKICLHTCNVGDPVLVVWDEVQRNYTILQDSNTLHFLHPDSVDQLGLRPASDGSPRKLYCPAEVVEREFCALKKSGNRYNLKEGERFYRVKVKPLMSVIHTA